MKFYPTDRRWLGKQREFDALLNHVFSNMKVLFGSVNNSIYLLMGDSLMPFANDQKTKRYVKKVWKEWKDYEVNLKYGDMRFFDLKYMTEESRALFADDFTNNDYFDLWTSQGSEPYHLIRPLCLALAHKYRLLLERYGVKQAKDKSMLMMMMGRFDLQKAIHRRLVSEAARNCGVVVRDMQKALSCYSLERVYAAYTKLLHEVIPELRHMYPDELEEKNIDGLQTQINQRVDTLDFYFSGLQHSTEDYEEIFRSKESQNEMMQDIKNMRDYFDNAVK